MNWGVKLLQSSALPLGYGAVYKKASSEALNYGADDEARTRYLNLGKVALYRVSYIRKCKHYYNHSCSFCQYLFQKNCHYLYIYLLHQI